MSLTFHASWMVCALGAAVFAAVSARRAFDLVALAATFAVAAVMVTADRLPDPVLVGLSAGVAAVVALVWPRSAILAAATGGALAGVLTGLLEAQGLPAGAAALMGGSLLGVAAGLSRWRPAFAPDVLREEGLLAVAVLGAGVAMLPGLLDGWRTAGTLRIASNDAAMEAIPAWALTVVLLSLLLGATASVWSRR